MSSPHTSIPGYFSNAAQLVSMIDAAMTELHYLKCDLSSGEPVSDIHLKHAIGTLEQIAGVITKAIEQHNMQVA